MQKAGRLELADQGTLFLDEIGDIPLELQPKLLRLIQEREFERLGSTRTKQVNVRVIAATHRDLEEMVSRNEFRSDLYYRLNVIPSLFLHCENGRTTFRSWCGILFGSLRIRWANESMRFRRKRWRRWFNTHGPVTSANCRTSSSEPWRFMCAGISR